MTSQFSIRSSSSKSSRQPTTTTNSNSSRPLRRGQACINCRQLKIKCDGNKPICGPCTRNPRSDPCEYTDELANSRTRALEEQVSQLNARIWELEHPGELQLNASGTGGGGRGGSEVLLRDPYLDSDAASPLPPVIPQEWTSNSSSTNTHSPSPTAHTPPVILNRIHHRTASDSASSHGSSDESHVRSIHATLKSPIGPSQPAAKKNSLIQIFCENAPSLGFFLSLSRFRASLSQSSSPSPHSSSSALVLPPSPALVAAACLWGARLSHDPEEPSLLNKAFGLAAVSLLSPPSTSHSPSLYSSTLPVSPTSPSFPSTSSSPPSSQQHAHPTSIVHAIQTHILLAHYALHTGRFAEAKVQSGAATSLVLAFGLHRLRSRFSISSAGLLPLIDASSTETNFIGIGMQMLPPTTSVLEGERINAFWSTFVLHKSLAVTLDPEDSLCGSFEAPGIQIDTPWPLDVDRYQEGLPTSLLGGWTVRNFLNDVQPTNPFEGQSNLALKSKAVVLFHRAAYLSGQWHPGLNERESQAYLAAFGSLSNLLDGFRAGSMPPIDNEFGALTRTLVAGSLIRLHRPFVAVDVRSHEKCLVAARDVVGIASRIGAGEERGKRLCEPMFGTVWMDACLQLVYEISRLRAIQHAWTAGIHMDGVGGLGSNHVVFGENELLEMLNQGISAMFGFTAESVLMNVQYTKVQEACRSM